MPAGTIANHQASRTFKLNKMQKIFFYMVTNNIRYIAIIFLELFKMNMNLYKIGIQIYLRTPFYI